MALLYVGARSSLAVGLPGPTAPATRVHFARSRRPYALWLDRYAARRLGRQAHQPHHHTTPPPHHPTTSPPHHPTTPADTRFGGFTTPPRHQPEVGLGNDLDMGGDDGDGGGVTMVVVSGDSPLKGIADAGGSDDEEEELGDEAREGMDAEELLAAEGQKGKGVSSLWQTISAVAERPFGGLDATLHIGGQVDMDGVTNDAAALIGRAAREPPGSKVREQLEEAALDRLRDAYRTHWNLPGTRQALAQGCHLMLRARADVGAAVLGPARSPTGGGIEVDEDEEAAGMVADAAGGAEGGSGGSGGSVNANRARLCGMVEQVYREYQRQLWDPALGGDGQVGWVDTRRHA